MQEYVIYGTMTQYISIQVVAANLEDALSQAMIKYDYCNAIKISSDKSFELHDTFIKFDAVDD